MFHKPFFTLILISSSQLSNAPTYYLTVTKYSVISSISSFPCHILHFGVLYALTQYGLLTFPLKYYKLSLPSIYFQLFPLTYPVKLIRHSLQLPLISISSASRPASRLSTFKLAPSLDPSFLSYAHYKSM